MHETADVNKAAQWECFRRTAFYGIICNAWIQLLFPQGLHITCGWRNMTLG